MSEWYSCPHCHANRETGCACPNSKCVDGAEEEEPLPKFDHVANKLVRIRNQVAEYMQELENRDVTKLTITELIELKTAACLVQNSGIDANHAVERMIRRWKEKHRPQELRDYEQYQREQNERMCAPNPLAASAEVLSEIDQTP
jgi:uncharacterized sporulation protein YeaH/YhbH (DUF444 family)